MIHWLGDTLVATSVLMAPCCSLASLCGGSSGQLPPMAFG